MPKQRIGEAWIDESEFPLLVWRFPECTDEAWAAHLERVAGWLETCDREFAVVADCTHMGASSARKRKCLADFARRVEPCQRWNAGMGIVVDRPVVRHVLTGILWMLPSPRYPLETFDALAPAQRWATQCLLERHAQRALGRMSARP